MKPILFQTKKSKTLLFWLYCEICKALYPTLWNEVWGKHERRIQAALDDLHTRNHYAGR